ncbi:MAG: hypothetical protein ACYTFI_25310 [Planctomycetota bacterium]
MTYDQINKVWHRSGAALVPFAPSTWYYQGSDDLCHYFARRKLLSEDSRTYTVEKSEILVGGAFPLTQVQSEWRRIDVRLASFQTPADIHFPKTLNFTKQ